MTSFQAPARGGCGRERPGDLMHGLAHLLPVKAYNATV